MAEWPVVVTNRCADRCASEFGSAERELARVWLARQIPLGRITNQLPRALGSRRSPSGRFLVVDQVLALPLKADEQECKWIATDCILFPEYRKPPDLDPFTLHGRRLLQQVDFTEHVVQRFQERCPAHRDPRVARQQLWDSLEPTVRAVRERPAWCRTKPSDFFLVAADEFCLPAKWQGGGGKAFTVTTCIHRASDLFELDPGGLLRHCKINKTRVEPYDHRELGRAIAATGRLSWYPPAWAQAWPNARFWIKLDNRRAIPVTWQPNQERQLIVLGVAERRTLLSRFTRWARKLFRTP